MKNKMKKKIDSQFVSRFIYFYYRRRRRRRGGVKVSLRRRRRSRWEDYAVSEP